MKICTIPECNRVQNAKGYCITHYRRWQVHGDPMFGRVESEAARREIRAAFKCSIEGCDKPYYTNGYCQMHGWRLKEHGDPLYVKSEYNCSVDGCERPYKAKGFCGLHYQRNARGYIGISSVSDSKRYRQVVNREHPIARSDGRLSVHRMVLFDNIGMVKIPCFWCATPLQWIVDNPLCEKLFVDHLYFNRQNNDITNLVPSCNSCNTSRTRRNKDVINMVSIYNTVYNTNSTGTNIMVVVS